jgi:hypothetical protein
LSKDRIRAGAVAGPALAGSVAFPTLNDGANVGSPCRVDFSVDGMEVRPAKDGLADGA